MFHRTSSEESDEFSPEKSHPPPTFSPASGAESLFLAGLAVSNISANALAGKLREATKSANSVFSSERSSALSVATTDFHSCVQNDEDLYGNNLSDDDSTDRVSLPEVDSDSDSDDIEQTKTMSTTAATPVPKAAPTKMPPKVEVTTTPAPAADEHMDPATHVYEGVKGVWTWGKGVPLVGFGLGIAEAVASKAVSVVGTNFEDIDTKVKPQLASLDNGILNPAIEKIVAIVLGAAGKTEGFMMPILVKLLSPFGLIKNEAENPEVTK